MIRTALIAAVSAVAGFVAGTWTSHEPACTALLMHPRGDVVASLIDGEWISDDGSTVEVDHLTRMTAEENCP